MGCGWTGALFGASYPDAACHDGVLWDLDGDGPSDADTQPCPNCQTLAFLVEAKRDAEGTVYGSANGELYDGLSIWDGALSFAATANPKATIAAAAQIGPFEVEAWPDKVAVLEGRASPKVTKPLLVNSPVTSKEPQ